MSDLCKMTPGMAHAGIVEGSVAHVIASTWKYGNCYTNSIEIAVALGLDPNAPALRDDGPEGPGEEPPARGGWNADGLHRTALSWNANRITVPMEVATIDVIAASYDPMLFIHADEEEA